MVRLLRPRCHGKSATAPRPSELSPTTKVLPVTPRAIATTRSGLKLGDQLRPHRDHPDEEPDGRQRRRFLDKNFQHSRLLALEHNKNIVPVLFFLSRGEIRILVNRQNRPQLHVTVKRNHETARIQAPLLRMKSNQDIYLGRHRIDA
jgi:hypothetical protein